MKPSELAKLLRRALNESDGAPLTEAEEKFYTALHPAVLSYEDEMRLGHPASERRCMICEMPLSWCCC
jgi:hypothetical protein